MAPTATQARGDAEEEGSRQAHFTTQEYEDLLASAVLSKVLDKRSDQRCQDAGNTDTDSGLSGSAQTPPQRNSCTPQGGSLSPGGAPSSDSDSHDCPWGRRGSWLASPDHGVDLGTLKSSTEQLVPSGGRPLGEEQQQHFPTAPDEAVSPLQFKIEEHIEEITTHHHFGDHHHHHHSHDDSDSCQSSRELDLRESLDDGRPDADGDGDGRWCKQSHQLQQEQKSLLHHSPSLPALLHLPPPHTLAPRRVPFPELGGDLLNAYLPSSEDDSHSSVGTGSPPRSPPSSPRPGDVVLDPDPWQENWLFKRQKLARCRDDPIAMVIPEAVDHPGRVTVGERDIDELSELSELTSISSSEFFESDSDGGSDLAPSAATPAGDRALAASPSSASVSSEDCACDTAGSHDCKCNASSRRVKMNVYSVSAAKILKVTGDSQTMLSPGNYDSPVSVSRTAQTEKSFKGTSQAGGPSVAAGSGKSSFGAGLPGQSSSRTLLSRKSCEAVQTGKPSCETTQTGKPSSGTLNKAKFSHRDKKFHRQAHSKSAPASRHIVLKGPSKVTDKNTEDVSILSPPSEVPCSPHDLPSRSETVSFAETPEDLTVSEGRTARLVCKVLARRPVGVSWYHEGRMVVRSGTAGTWRQDAFHHLDLYEMDTSRSGVYHVAAYTASHCVWAQCVLQCRASSRPRRPPRVVRPLRRVPHGDQDPDPRWGVTLECQVAGHPEPRVFFSGGEVPLVHCPPSCSVEDDQYGLWMLRLDPATAASVEGRLTATVISSEGRVSTAWDGVSCHPHLPPQQRLRQEGESPGEVPVASRAPKTPRSCSDRHLTPDAQQLQQQQQLQQDSETADSSIFISSPQPGTIAEREHRKWREAAPLADNPYSPHRLTHRLASHPTALPTCRDISDVDTAQVKASCGDRADDDDVQTALSRDLTRYRRDYYVAGAASAKETSFWLGNTARNSPKELEGRSRNNSSTTASHQENEDQTSDGTSGGNSKQCSGSERHKTGGTKQESATSATTRVGSNTTRVDWTVSVPEAFHSKSSNWKEECSSSIKPASVERAVCHFQSSMAAARGRAGPRRVVHSSHESLCSDPPGPPPPRRGLYRTVSVDALQKTFENLSSDSSSYSRVYRPSRYFTTEVPVSSVNNLYKKNAINRSFNRNSRINRSSSVGQDSVTGERRTATSTDLNWTGTEDRDRCAGYRSTESRPDQEWNSARDRDRSTVYQSTAPSTDQEWASTGDRGRGTGNCVDPKLASNTNWNYCFERPIVHSSSLGHVAGDAPGWDGAWDASQEHHSLGCFSGSHIVASASRGGGVGRRWKSVAASLQQDDDLEPPFLPLPCVRQLASKFDSLGRAPASSGGQGRRPGEDAAAESSANPRGSAWGARGGGRAREVHSLTARSVPRPFREGLNTHRPRQPNRNLLGSGGLAGGWGASNQGESASVPNGDHNQPNRTHRWGGSSEEDSSSTHNGDYNQPNRNLVGARAWDGHELEGTTPLQGGVVSTSPEPNPFSPPHYTPMSSTYYNFTRADVSNGSADHVPRQHVGRRQNSDDFGDDGRFQRHNLEVYDQQRNRHDQQQYDSQHHEQRQQHHGQHQHYEQHQQNHREYQQYYGHQLYHEEQQHHEQQQQQHLGEYQQHHEQHEKHHEQHQQHFEQHRQHYEQQENRVYHPQHHARNQTHPGRGSPDHLGIPGSRATLAGSRPPCGEDTSDDSPLQSPAAARYSRRASRC